MTTSTSPSTPARFAGPPTTGAVTPDAGHPAGPDPAAPRSRGERLALAALLLFTGVLYLWDLGASGWANDFYAAAAQAGTRSWKAFFFGSLDPSNFITVDKPPASLWPMEIAGRIVGFSSWSMLVPQALEGVAAVGLLTATVRRWSGPGAGLLAGALLSITPVAVLMFRFDNPDALMVLLIVLAAYCTTRAIEAGSARWITAAGLVMGLSFLTKGLQPFTVVPALAAAFLVAAPLSLRARLGRLLLAGAGILVGAGWWLLAVQLTPAADRPYIGGSGDNSPLGLAFGYNGLSRITGGSGPGNGASFSGSTGIGRLFNDLDGGQIAWLLPAALVSVVALVVTTRRAPRTDRTRAALIVWGGWLLVTGGVLSFASGIIHTYYTVELAPAIAALVAITTVVLWRSRAQLAARVVLASGVLLTGVWSWELLRRSSGWHPWLSVAVLAVALVAAGALLGVPATARDGHTGRAVTGVAIVAGLLGITGGSAAYALDTAATPHAGGIPSAGPTVAGAFGGAGGRPAAAIPGAGSRGLPRGLPSGLPGGPSGASRGGPAGGVPAFGRPPRSGSGALPGFGGPAGSGATAGGPPAGVIGAPGGGTTVSSALVTVLQQAGTRWSAATVGAQTAAPLELDSGTAVMAIGGFNGSDAAPTLARFRSLVARGEVHYFIAAADGFGGPGGGPGGSGTGGAITGWVEAHFSSTTVGGTTVYDLTTRTSR